MIPIWKKSKSELTDDDYNQFYKSKFSDYEDPLRHIHTSTEGAATYHAMLFIPGRAPYNYYSKDYEKGLQLYSNGVLIMDKCADLLPDYFSFVRGLVDSADLSLNISREMLQHDRHLKVIAQSIEKKIKNELLSMQKNDREKYETFFKAFGAYMNYGMHKDVLEDLLIYHSDKEDKMVSLAEYVEKMPEEQKHIYYACGETIEKCRLLPAMELLRDKGYDVLCMTDNVDEFTVRMLNQYKEKTFKSIADGDLGLETEEEKEEIKKQAEEHASVLTAIKDALGDKVARVQLTGRLKSHPCCLSTEGGMSLEMEKVLNQQAMGTEQTFHAERVLELNGAHPIFDKLCALAGSDTDKLAKLSSVLYNQALLIEGMPIDNPVEYANAVCSLLTD